MTKHSSPSVSEICDILGRRAIAERLGRSRSAIYEGTKDGLFPSPWYLKIKAMCGEAGVECPDDLFNFLPENSVRSSAEDAA